VTSGPKYSLVSLPLGQRMAIGVSVMPILSGLISFMKHRGRTRHAES